MWTGSGIMKVRLKLHGSNPAFAKLIFGDDIQRFVRRAIISMESGKLATLRLETYALDADGKPITKNGKDVMVWRRYDVEHMDLDVRAWTKPIKRKVKGTIG